jgi:hypothetical protein
MCVSFLWSTPSELDGNIAMPQNFYFLFFTIFLNIRICIFWGWEGEFRSTRIYYTKTSYVRNRSIVYIHWIYLSRLEEGRARKGKNDRFDYRVTDSSIACQMPRNLSCTFLSGQPLFSKRKHPFWFMCRRYCVLLQSTYSHMLRITMRRTSQWFPENLPWTFKKPTHKHIILIQRVSRSLELSFAPFW